MAYYHEAKPQLFLSCFVAVVIVVVVVNIVVMVLIVIVIYTGFRCDQ